MSVALCLKIAITEPMLNHEARSITCLTTYLIASANPLFPQPSKQSPPLSNEQNKHQNLQQESAQYRISSNAMQITSVLFSLGTRTCASNVNPQEATNTGSLIDFLQAQSLHAIRFRKLIAGMISTSAI